MARARGDRVHPLGKFTVFKESISGVGVRIDSHFLCVTVVEVVVPVSPKSGGYIIGE